ncbi:MAG: DUF5703 domain-containing protein [Candidatus Sumerlaeota bacterium]|nr:DUF5703 domain-containing protein [Candidatus Sumerlaeota bacterium]
MRRIIGLTVALAGLAFGAFGAKTDSLDRCNVVWDSPSADAKGSMPAGNGDIGLNVWVEPSGDLVFLISKTDAWDENMRLVKVGKVRVRFTPPLAQAGKPFTQTLQLAQGRVLIRTADAEVSVWADANHPVIQVDAKSLAGQPLAASAAVELWRVSKQPCDPGYPNFPGSPAFSWPDTVLKSTPEQIGWFHRNAASPWLANLKLQKLDTLAQSDSDPILGRVFGAVVRGDNFTATSDTALKTAQPVNTLSLRVHVLTRAGGTADEWRAALEKQVDAVEALPAADRWTAHCRWWEGFWNRSWIYADGAKAAESVTRAYTLQRWINACAGRGEFPIKFNGSIFVVDHADKRGFDADFRAWGGCYWWQNTRLIYWSMLTAGDFDLMPALFGMYMKALPSRQLATKTYYGHSGAFYPETMTFWGACNDRNYGPDRTNKADGLTDNQFIRRYWQGGIEMIALMLDYYDLTQDAKFRDDTLLPFATQIIAFFDQHWKRGPDGKILFHPSQSLETWWDCANPLPEIAGLRYVIPRLQQIAGANTWQKTLDDLPPVPLSADKKRLVPAEKFASKHNSENTELYAVFPYRLYGAGQPDLPIARDTFAARANRHNGGWCQDAIQAACLGLGDETARMLAARAGRVAPGFRFPAIWGPNFDWMPDQDHGTGGMSALQRMLIQYEGRKILVLPAWPKDWNVAFKLHAPYNTTVEGICRNGKLEQLEVLPPDRQKDVVICKESDK